MTAFSRAVAAVREGAPVEREARTLIDQLTTGERLWLLDGDAPFWRGTVRYAREGYGRTPQLGGANARLGIPGLRFTDGPRGVTLGSSTCFPVAMARGASWDVELEREIARAMGREARAQGANCIGAPCINLLRHPAWGRAQETYGEDPVHVGALGVAFALGVQEHVMACVKHFALNSIENARFQVDVEVADDVLHEVYLPHFKDVVDAGARVVMSAYNAVNGVYCGDSKVLLTDILRDDWKFTGFVISDWIWGLRDPVGSMRAGLDIEMPFRQQRSRALPAALARGELAESDLERSVLRIVTTQLRHAAALGEPPSREVVAGAEHRALARRAAVRSITLLRNEPVSNSPALPLDATALRRLAVIGRLAGTPNLGDPGSSNVHPPSTVTILDGLRAALPGVAIETDEHRAADADAAIVVVGYRAVDEGEYLLATDPASLALLPWPLSTELAGRALRWLSKRYQTSGKLFGGDREKLTLREADEAMIARVVARNPRTIVVVIAGSAVVMERWREAVPAIVLAWYPGMEGGHAVADVLLGAEPGGRLPFVVPTTADHLPEFDRDARRIRYERLHGYRKLAHEEHPPAFPFGFGLSYTTFRLAALAVDHTAHTATVSVTNTGAREGSTVVQLYASLAGEPRQLVGFTRITLAAGATTTVTVRWRAATLARWVGGRFVPPAGPIRFEAARWAGDLEAVVA